VPHLQKRKLPKPLEYYAKKYSDQKIAINHAYLSGGYTLKETGNYFGMYYSTISRIVKANEWCGLESPYFLPGYQPR
jgi:hypothetical protein